MLQHKLKAPDTHTIHTPIPVTSIKTKYIGYLQNKTVDIGISSICIIKHEEK
jgi:hypothetical protein